MPCRSGDDVSHVFVGHTPASCAIAVPWQNETRSKDTVASSTVFGILFRCIAALLDRISQATIEPVKLAGMSTPGRSDIGTPYHYHAALAGAGCDRLEWSMSFETCQLRPALSVYLLVCG
jgi:hypothetical protein